MMGFNMANFLKIAPDYFIIRKSFYKSTPLLTFLHRPNIYFCSII